ncbi:MAG: hypothetical protein ABFD54_01145 [Armatimonadota bacterium]|nr:hypothetical protein [bacterium]
MRTLCFAVAMLAIVASASVAGSVTVDFYGPGWALVSAPQVPIESRAVYLWDPDFTEWLDSKLFAVNPTTGSQVPLSYGDNAETFSILLGEGYLLNNTDGPTQVTYDAVADGVPSNPADATTMTDMWISLPGRTETGTNLDQGGWHLIGCPFNHVIPFDKAEGSFAAGDNIYFTDGTTVKTWADASTGNDAWVSPTMFGRDGRGQFQATYDGDPSEVDLFLRPGYGYWFQTKKDNLAMIVTAKADWDPSTYQW